MYRLFPRSHTAPALGPQRSAAEVRAAAARRAFVMVAIAILPIMVLASVDFGVTFDEKARHRYGQNILEYYQGLRTRASFDQDGGSPYGGLFDFICAVVEQWLPFDRYVVRHGINAVFGWIGIVYSGRLAARLFGPWSGVLTMLLLATAPRYFADSMNNPKDLPFASMSVTALYYISTASRRWPFVPWPTAAKIALALGLALNIRAGALLHLGYFGLLIAGFVVAGRRFEWRRFADTAARVALVSVATLLLGTAFWPWAQGAPFTRPIEALIGFANYGEWGALVLYRGADVPSTELPWDYVPWWFLISTPPVVLIGAALSIAALRRTSWRIPIAVLWASALLPVVLVIARQSTLYDGIRHLLFLLPVVVVLAAAGWSAGLTWPGRPRLRVVTAVLLVAGFVDVVAFHTRYHPNQTVYFNALAGGPRGALGKYDLDYWGNCMLEAVDWTARAARQAGRGITISGHPWQLVQTNAERFRELHVVPPHRSHELNVRLNRGSAEGVAELAAADALYRVETPDGALLCAVVPGPMFDRLLEDVPLEIQSRRRP